MELEQTLEESRQMRGPLGAIAFVVLRGLKAGGAEPAEIAQVDALLTRCFPNLSAAECDVLVEVVDTRLAEGSWGDPIKLIGGLTETEAHIAHDALSQQDIETKIRNEHGDLPNPGVGVELWIRPRDHAKAKRLLSRLNEAHQGESVLCPECGESSLAHFTSCWSCGEPLKSGG